MRAFVKQLHVLLGFMASASSTLHAHREGIRQYDSCDTGVLDRHAQHQQPCLASEGLVLLSDKSNLVYQGHTGLRSCTVRYQ